MVSFNFFGSEITSFICRSTDNLPVGDGDDDVDKDDVMMIYHKYDECSVYQYHGRLIQRTTYSRHTAAV